METSNFFSQETKKIEKKDFGDHKVLIIKSGESAKVRLFGPTILAKQLWISPKGKPFPIYVPEDSDFSQEDLDKAYIQKNGKPSVPQECGATAVYDYATKEAKVLVVPKYSKLYTAIHENQLNDDWGDPTKYDMTIAINGQGAGMTVSAVPSPKKELPKDIVASLEKVSVEQTLFGIPQNILDARRVFDGNKKDDVTIEDIPF